MEDCQHVEAAALTAEYLVCKLAKALDDSPRGASV